jgi:hypothetical protein
VKVAKTTKRLTLILRLTLHFLPQQFQRHMPPKKATDALRGRGRPKRDAALEPAPAANAPAKRGRAAKADVVEAPVKPVEPPKKRGRPGKAAVEETVAVVEAPKRGRRSLVAPEVAVQEEEPTPKKRMGRPPKTQIAAKPAETPKKRAGRPAKADATIAVAVEETVKRRGRPAKNAAAVDLNRVAGSPRVTKSRARPAAKATTAAAAPRIDPRVRSKLRTRVPQAQKVEQAVVAQPTKRRGRPAKAAVKVAPPAPIKAKATKAAAVKPVAPRKRRGYTTIEVPDRFASEVKRYLKELLEEETNLPPVDGAAEEVAEQHEEEDVGEDVEEDVEVEAEAGAEEEDVDMTVEEEVLVTSDAMGSVEDDNVEALAEEANLETNFSADGDANADADMDEDMDAQEQDIQDDFADEQVDEQIEEAPEVELEMDVRETVQIQVNADDADALVQEELDQTLGSGDDGSSLMGDNDTSAFVRDAEPAPMAGFLFGPGILSS